MNRPTASAVPRILTCAASAVLTQHDYKTAFADEGHDRHEEAEADIDTGDLDKLPPEVRRLMLPGDETATECAFAYDAATGTARELGHIKRRAYQNLRPFDIPGTIDLLIRGSGRVIVVDWKGYEEVDDAERNLQTATYALMVARAYGLDEVTVAIVYLAGFRRPSVAVLSAMDLDAHAERLKQMYKDVASAAQDPEPFLVVSKACKYCPSFLACPRQSALKAELGAELVTVRIEATIPFHDDVEAADAFELLGRIKLIANRLSAGLYARAAERPIPLLNGKMFGPVEKMGSEKLDGDVVFAVVKEKHGAAIADTAVVRTATKKRLKDALGFVGAKSVAAAERDVLDEVRARGGSKKEKKVAIEEYDAVKLLRATS